MFNYIGGLDYTYKSQKLTDPVIQKNLKNRFSIYLSVDEDFGNDYKYLNPDSAMEGDHEVSAHAIVLCGRYLASKICYYVYMDSNCGTKGYVVNSIPASLYKNSYSDKMFYYLDNNGTIYGRWLGTWSKYYS